MPTKGIHVATGFTRILVNKTPPLFVLSPVAISLTWPARPVDEVRLVEAARTGDRVAFEELYLTYARLVHGVLLSRVPLAVVDDLAQDVFVHALERLATLREAAAFGGWLCAIARNRATDYLRRAPVQVELPDDLPGPETRHAEAMEVLAVIATLPDAYRETLVLRLVEGLTGPEIAALTGLTPASVRVNLHRGMKQLRQRLERSGRHD